MDESFFVAGDHSTHTYTYRATSATIGPWSGQLQHGGPPCALLVHVAEHYVAHELGRLDLVALRIAAEFAGPVPVGEVLIDVSIVRAARSAVLVRADLSSGGRRCLSAGIWLLTQPERPPDSPVPVSAVRPLVVPETSARWGGSSFPYGQALDWRVEAGSLTAPGPCRVWARQRIPLVAGWAPSGLQRVALVADSGNGVSAVLDWRTWSFMNVDLDVHLARPLRGDWVRLDAATQLGPAGTGLASSILSDVDGVCGTGAQTLVVRELQS